MKTWQRSLLCVLFCVVGLNSVVYAWPLDLALLNFTLIGENEAQVSPSDDRSFEAPSIVSTPEGHLYAVYEAREYADDGTELTTSLHISRSFDGGRNWEGFMGIAPPEPGMSVYNPSITYLEKGTQKLICIVYGEGTLDSDGSRIKIARIDIGPNGYISLETVDYLSSSQPLYAIYPEICTDYPLETSNPSLYVAYSMRIGSYYGVRLFRSMDLGETWDYIPYTSLGEWPETQLSHPAHPDIEYGSAGLFLVYRYIEKISSVPEYTTKIRIRHSTDKGDSWIIRHEFPFEYFGFEPNLHQPRPRVSVSIGNPSVLVAYSDAGKHSIEYTFSMDGRTQWQYLSSLFTANGVIGNVELGRSKSGETFHAAFYKNGNIYYTAASTTSPWEWTPPIVINEGHTASSSKPSVHFDPKWPEQEAVIAWEDHRDMWAICEQAGMTPCLEEIYLGTSSDPREHLSLTSPFAWWIGGSETMSYTVTVENIFEDLNLLTVTNQLSDLVTYTSGSVALNGVVQEPLAVTDGLWTYTADDLAYGDVLTFSFDVVVDTGIDPGDLISNLINVQYVYGLSNTLLEYSREVVIYVETIPEPATWALIGLGLLGGGLLLRRKRRARTR